MCWDNLSKKPLEQKCATLLQLFLKVVHKCNRSPQNWKVTWGRGIVTVVIILIIYYKIGNACVKTEKIWLNFRVTLHFNNRSVTAEN